jgi:tetratricopeptide (TPR) repeat protein
MSEDVKESETPNRDISQEEKIQRVLRREYPLRDTPEVATDFAYTLLASDIRKSRTHLTSLSNTSIGWAELLLATSTLAFGAFLGVLPSDLKQGTGIVSDIYYSYCPLIAVTTLVIYLFLKKEEAASTRMIAQHLLEVLPEVPTIKNDDFHQTNIQIKIDRDNLSLVDSKKIEDAEVREGSLAKSRRDFDTWSKEDFSFRYAMALFDKRVDDADAIDEYQKKNLISSDELQKRRWEALTIFWKVFTKNGGKFSSLKDLAVNPTMDSEICADVSAVYSSSNDYENAIAWLEKAVSAETEIVKKIRYLSDIAVYSNKNNDGDGALRTLNRLNALDIQSDSEIAAHLNGAKKLFESQKRDELSIAVMEALLGIDPTDHELRFSLAYKYGELHSEEIAAFHYQLISESTRSANGWNNLGVAFTSLKLPSLAAAAFQKAHELGETLATSNLANVMIDAGLHTQAKDLIATATSRPHDIRLDQSVVRLDEMIKKEEERKEQLLSKTGKLSAFYRKFGYASTTSLGEFMSGTFSDSIYELVVTVSEGQFTASGSEVIHLNSLARAVAGTSDENIPDKRVNVSGELIGSAVISTFNFPSATTAAISLLSMADQKTVLMIIDVKNDQIYCLEDPRKKEWNIRTLKRKERTAKIPNVLV